MKLKTILFLIKESSGYGTHGGSLGGPISSQDNKLRPYPGSMDDVEDWDGFVEHKNWFLHVEANNWETKKAGASVYITEGDPKKYSIRIKTHGLRKPNDTNESYRQRVKKHSNKVAREWVSAAKKLHDNPEINEVGNEIPITWNEAFKLALEDMKVHPYVAEWGESNKKESSAMADPVNFTYVK